MPSPRIALAALVIAGAIAGCGSPGGSGRDGGPTVSDSGPIDLCSARFALARRRPEIELLIDRSCAMTMRFDGSAASGPTDPESRWNAVRTGLEALPSLGVSGVGVVLSPDG